MELTITINYNPAEKSAVKFLKDVISLNTFDDKIIIFKSTGKKPKEISIDYIQKVVCNYFNLSAEQLINNIRKRETVQARQIAMYFSKSLTKCSLATIGSQIGGKDHATCLWGIKQVNNLIQTDKTFRNQIEEIKKLLK